MSATIKIEYDRPEKPFVLEVNLNDTVLDLKGKLEVEQGQTKEKQSLFFNETLLIDDQTLSSYNITHGSLLKLTMEQNNLITLFVKLPSGESSTDIRISPLKSTWELKNKIYEKHGYQPELQELVYAGDVLADSKALYKYEIGNETTVHLTIKPEQIIFTIKLPNGKSSVRTMSATTTVAALKKQLLDEYGYDPEEQILVYGQSVLGNDKTLEDHGISSNATLHLVIEAKDALRVNLKRPNQEMLVLLMRQSSSVKEVKAQIKSSDNIPVETITLKLDGKVLEDERVLSDYNLTDDTELELIVKDIEFTVKLPDGKSLKYVNSPYLAITDLKQMINKERTDIPIRKQSLLYKQMLLIENTCLHNYAITHGAVIHLVFSIIPMLLVTPDTKEKKGEKVRIEINLYDSVYLLKRRIEELMGYQASKQILIENGNMLQNDSLLREYPFTAESVLYLVMSDAERVPFFIKPTYEDDLRFDLPLYTAIGAIKKKLSERLYVTPDKIAFLMQIPPGAQYRTLLEDHKRLVEYGITNGSEIYMETEPLPLKIKFIAYRDLLEITLSPNDDIRKLKEKIKDIKGVPMDSQVLRYNGEILENSRLPEHYKIRHSCEIELRITYKVFVKTPAGDLIILNTEATETILDLKNKINEKKKYPIENQTLIFITKTLEDDKQLNNCNIEEESTLFLILRHDLTVRTKSGEEGTIKVTTYEPVKKLKSLIQEKLNFSTDGSKLKLEGTLLEEERNLDSYGWKAGQIITIE